MALCPGPPPWGLGWLAALALGAACAAGRPLPADSQRCANWTDPIGPLLAARCSGCHGGPMPAGGYDVTTYLGAIGAREEVPRATAGDATSPILRAIDPAAGSAVHREVVDLLPQLTSWVVDCRLSSQRSAIHDPGILNPADGEQFHGAVLRDSGWRLATCAGCHGSDFAGGRAKKSCLGCHPAGPTACDTCHGRLASGAHRIHVAGGAIGKPLDCGECHRKPAAYTDPGHLFDETGAPLAAGAAVRFGPLAQQTPPGTRRDAPPSWDGEARTCQNVYCHGAVFADSPGGAPPRWVKPVAETRCGACHGAPPSSHSLDGCVLCHGGTVDDARRLKEGSLHINGRIDIGDGGGTCSACHGGAAGPAPPRDLLGNTEVSAIGVGVHKSHLGALHRLRGPIACGDCHLVPGSVDSLGHIDGDRQAEVFPSGTRAQSLAFADSAKPRWDHDGARCAEVYCHGGGTKLGRDLTPDLLRAPAWMRPGQIGCGSACHGVPPSDGDHTPGLRLTDCATCHPATMDDSGAILVTGPPGAQKSAHINGVVDAR